MFGINTCIVVFEQLRAKVNFTRQMCCWIYRKHTNAATESHSHMEELSVQLTVLNVMPERFFGVVLNTVISLQRHCRQRVR
ncbi:Uncharacterised protein [Shigella flexneri]|nr:Uncharacterised protein [Shigella flexneri]